MISRKYVVGGLGTTIERAAASGGDPSLTLLLTRTTLSGVPRKPRSYRSFPTFMSLWFLVIVTPPVNRNSLYCVIRGVKAHSQVWEVKTNVIWDRKVPSSLQLRRNLSHWASYQRNPLKDRLRWLEYFDKFKFRKCSPRPL